MDGHSRERPRLRHAGRVLLFDRDVRLLLLHARPRPGVEVWITPGGGVEAGESHADAARREAHEELGLTDLALSPCVWRRRHTWYWAVEDIWFDYVERFFVARISDLDVNTLPSDERARWWTLDAIRRHRGPFAPRALPALIEPIVRGELPDPPLQLES